MKYNQLETYSQRLDAIVENAHDGIIAIDSNKHLTFINTAARSMFGYSAEQALNLSLDQLIPARIRQRHDDHIASFRHSQERARAMQTRTSVLGLRQDGSEFPIEVSISKIVVSGKMEMVAVMRDISARSQLIQELKEAATLDHLTGLANKKLFHEEMLRLFALTKRYGRHLSLIMADLDHFKSINDRYGHACGDEVLKTVANIMSSHLRDSDLAARWGGEEFALLLPETNREGASILAEKLRKKIQHHVFCLKGEKTSVTCSFGVFSIDNQHSTPERLFEQADKHMYQAKKDGRNCVR